MISNDDITKILIENRKMREALNFIYKWQLPQLEFQGQMCSYGTVRGSNGERDYMRNVAKTALEE